MATADEAAAPGKKLNGERRWSPNQGRDRHTQKRRARRQHALRPAWISPVNVTAFSTPRRPDWRWRIVTYAGEVVEESFESFATIALALTEGTKRMTALNVVDRSVPMRPDPWSAC